jgi:hypothetical protein
MPRGPKEKTVWRRTADDILFRVSFALGTSRGPGALDRPMTVAAVVTGTMQLRLRV